MASTYAIGKIELPDGGVCNLVGLFPYGACKTAAATAAKEATCENFTALKKGLTIHVKFTYSNTAANPTLNVNGTGAKAIYRYGTTRALSSASTSWNAGTVVPLTYDGSAWYITGWLNHNTWTAMKGATATAAGTAGYVPAPPSEGYDAKYLRADGTWSVPACLVVDCGTISSLPKTINSAGITTDMVVLNSTLGTPFAQTSDWTVTTASGSVTISGSISGSTTLTLYLGNSR